MHCFERVRRAFAGSARQQCRDTTKKNMKSLIIPVTAAFVLVACDARVNVPPPVVEKNTTIVNPPAKEEKKVENNTTIINPPPAATTEEKKTTTTTTTEK